MNTSSNAVYQWRARPADEVVWRALDEDYVLYHRPSGKTHFLNAASRSLLSDILTTPQTAAAAADALASRSGVAADAAFVATVTDTLAQLDHLGLIDRV